VVHLEPLPDAANDFAGWKGGCAGTGPCDVTVSSDVEVSASFAATQVPVSIVIAGNGTVRSSPPGIECSSSCSGRFAAGTRVHLDAVSADGFAAAAFSGDCVGKSCDLDVSQSRTVTVAFAVVMDTLTVRLRGTGHGRVVSTPAGIDCGTGSGCTFSLPRNSELRLAASPDAISRLEFWSGACGTDPCTFRVRGDTVVDASFALRRFHLVDLGVAPGDWWSAATAMSADGKIVAGHTAGGRQTPVLFTPSLQTLGIDSGYAVGVTSARVVAGNAYVVNSSGYTVTYPFRWAKGVVTNLAWFPEGTFAMASAMNERGTVVGSASYNNGPWRAVAWGDSGITDLGSLGNAWNACSGANGINGAGTIVGQSCTPYYNQHAARFRGPGAIDDLGTLGGNSSVAVAINDAGDITGYSDVAQGKGTHGFLVRDGAMIDAGTLPGHSYSQLGAINNAGVATGLSYNPDQWPHSAVLYLERRMVAIDDLIDDARSVRVSAIGAIGDDGTMVGTASVFGSDRAVLLRPE
jgi:probable HAF family extracellular repeat protein